MEFTEAFLREKIKRSDYSVFQKVPLRNIFKGDISHFVSSSPPAPPPPLSSFLLTPARCSAPKGVVLTRAFRLGRAELTTFKMWDRHAFDHQFQSKQQMRLLVSLSLTTKPDLAPEKAQKKKVKREYKRSFSHWLPREGRRPTTGSPRRAIDSSTQRVCARGRSAKVILLPYFH